MQKRLCSLLFLLTLFIWLTGCSSSLFADRQAQVPPSEKLTAALMQKRIAAFLRTQRPGLKTGFVVAKITEYDSFRRFSLAYMQKRRELMMESSSAQHSPSEIDRMLENTSMMIFKKYGNRPYALVDLKDYIELDQTSHESRNYDHYFFATCKDDQGRWIVFEVTPLFFSTDTRVEIREGSP